jgi:hypothetical protein
MVFRYFPGEIGPSRPALVGFTKAIAARVAPSKAPAGGGVRKSVTEEPDRSGENATESRQGRHLLPSERGCCKIPACVGRVPSLRGRGYVTRRYVVYS